MNSVAEWIPRDVKLGFQMDSLAIILRQILSMKLYVYDILAVKSDVDITVTELNKIVYSYHFVEKHKQDIHVVIVFSLWVIANKFELHSFSAQLLKL